MPPQNRSANNRIGEPPLWKPLTAATRLEEDSGTFFRDQNAARYPDHPIEPATSVTLARNPRFDAQIVDVFACASTIGGFLRFVSGAEGRPVRFVVEGVGNTVFFVRRDNNPDEKITDEQGQLIRGHVHTFPDASTQWQASMEGSASHQRILLYKFAGLRCIIRYEADGYLNEHVGVKIKRKEGAASSGSETVMPEIAEVEVRQGGSLVPQNAVFELKTRSIKRRGEDFLADQLPRLWIFQTPFFVLAFHTRSVFDPKDIEITDVRQGVKQWEEENAASMRKLGVLMNRLGDLARERDSHRFEVCRSPGGLLEICSPGGDVLRALLYRLRKVWLGEAYTES